KNPRSTVGTVTEIYDYMRLLWARAGIPYSPTTGLPIESQTVSQMVDRVMALKEGTRLFLLAPVVRARKGEYRKELAEWAQSGFVRARIDGVVRRLDEPIALARYAYHTIELVVDRLTIAADARSRLGEAVEQAVQLGGGLCAIAWGDDGYRLFSTQRSCPAGHGSLPELEPRLFSFNSPIGACAACDGIGLAHGF
ncbi:MAG: excinuclease ABC subunit A, partial [Hyphomicrobiales bacterium]